MYGRADVTSERTDPSLSSHHRLRGNASVVQEGNIERTNLGADAEASKSSLELFQSNVFFFTFNNYILIKLNKIILYLIEYN